MNDEHTVLNHYNLTNAFPSTWPTENDDSEDSGEERPANGQTAAIRRSKSRYSALERHGSDGRRSLVPGSQKLRDGQENLVQRDEPDPLGASDSVVRVLRQRGLPVDDDSRLSEILIRREKSPANCIQGIGSFCLPLHSHQIYIFPKSIQPPLPRICCRVWTCSPNPSTRSLHP